YNITGGTFTAPSSNYSVPTFTGTPTLAITARALTATVTQSKIYGANDPALPLVVSPSGLVNDPAIVTWDGVVGINDSALTSNATALTRAVGEGVGVRNITAGTFSAPSANYTAPTLAGGSTLTINAAALNFALTTPGQTKVYGANDPALAGIGVTLTGLVNNPAIATWNGAASVNDSAATGTFSSLTRAAGEAVAGAPYAISAGAVTLSASDANYAKSFNASNSPSLAITQAPLTGTIPNQTKTYGASDPLAGVPVTLAGLVNNPAIATWNGNVAVNDTGLVSASLASLTRVAGETVAAPGPSYAITGGTLNALSGAAAGNYTASLSTAGNTLAITPAALAVSADNTSRPQGTPNPSFTATYGGLQFGETPAVLTGTLSFNTPAIASSPAGPYPITPYGQSSTNYAMNYVDGTLAVIGGSSPQILTGISDLATNLVVGGLQQLGSSAANVDAAKCWGSNSPNGIGLMTSASAGVHWVCANGGKELMTPVARLTAKKAPPVQGTQAASKPAP
ncbi:MAG: MBG domain-containing protein, partial [Burkholderiales bacterium]